MSPARLNSTLQADFVRTELETGHRMLAWAINQRSFRADDDAIESLSLARVALSGAERHLATVTLPRKETKELLRNVHDLRRQIESFEAGAHSRVRPAAHLKMPRRPRS